jgi:hypothetical protein
MFHGFPSYRQTASDARITLEAYLAVLEGFPSETVQEGARHALKAGGAFPPSSPEFYEICSRVAAERHAEQRRLYETKAPRLPRPVEALSEAEREASKARVQAMVDRLKGSNSMQNASKSRAEVREDAQSFLVENAGGHGCPPCRISAELAALIEDQRR